METTTITALWWAVIFSGAYHGINPGMGWPLAVSSALMHGKRRYLLTALGLLALGHLLAMMAILLPFSLMTALVSHEKELRIGAGVLVVLMGVYLLINRKHPKFLARVHPARLALWSFLAAMAHGAGLMLVPVYLGICSTDSLDGGHQAAQTLMNGNISTALTVAVVHTLAMTVVGGAVATIIYFWLGLKFLSSTWFNVDVVWALSLIVVGSFGIYSVYSH
ncbi:hypothetical protein AB833_24420 [Chromatiales bacterium (ex Bugula neritina AB1)]|nr:hypothetical protein AB833_24420 [Chromatiales bacterium (ex Bugula neritina AB1)]